MMLNISSALRSPGTAIPFVHKESLEDTVVLGETVTFPAPVVLKGTYSIVDNALVIKGQLSATARGECARCLSPVDYPLDVAVRETFLRVDPREKVEDDPWEERLVFTGTKVDLSHLFLSLVLLDLPIRFLCAQGCQSPGEIVPEDELLSQDNNLDDAHPFAALKQLYTKFQEE